jgi:FkbM family methyltransferase
VTLPAETTIAKATGGISSCFRQAGRKVVEIRFRRQSRSDRSMIRQIFAERGFAMDRWPQGRALEKYYRTELRGQRPLIIDAGANIGASILWFNAHYPGSSIFAIEPDDNNLAILKLNTRGLANLQVFRGALGGEQGTLFLTRKSSDAGHQVGAKGDIPVEVIDCNTILESSWAKDLRPFICKIDIEGSETKVFAANTDWMRQFPCIVIELHDWLKPFRRRSASFLRAALANDFDFVTRGEHIFLFNNALLGHMRKDQDVRQRPQKTWKWLTPALAPVLGRLQKMTSRRN